MAVCRIKKKFNKFVLLKRPRITSLQSQGLCNCFSVALTARPRVVFGKSHGVSVNVLMNYADNHTIRYESTGVVFGNVLCWLALAKQVPPRYSESRNTVAKQEAAARSVQMILNDSSE